MMNSVSRVLVCHNDITDAPAPARRPHLYLVSDSSARPSLPSAWADTQPARYSDEDSSGLHTNRVRVIRSKRHEFVAVTVTDEMIKAEVERLRRKRMYRSTDDVELLRIAHELLTRTRHITSRRTKVLSGPTVVRLPRDRNEKREAMLFDAKRKALKERSKRHLGKRYKPSGVFRNGGRKSPTLRDHRGCGYVTLTADMLTIDSVR